MTYRKLYVTLKALGVIVQRESGGIALYFHGIRDWAADLHEALEKGMDLGVPR